MSNNRMNIAVSVNNSFVMPLKIMLYSLAQNTSKDLHIYLLYTQDLSNKNRKILHHFITKYRIGTLYEILIDRSLFQEFEDPKSMFSLECYYRLLLPYVLEPSVDKIFWLDADVVVCGNMDEFYDADIAQYYLIATCYPEAGDIEQRKLHKQRLNIPQEQKYFNAGVLVFNLPAIRKSFSQQQILDFCIQNKEKLTYLDQDVLNYNMGHNTLFFNEFIYNNQEHLKDKITEDARLIHYTTFQKPWKVFYQGNEFATTCFWKYACGCGFRKKYIFFLIGNKICRYIYPIYLKLRYKK